MSRYIDIDKVLMTLRLDHKDVIYIDKNDTAKRIEKIQGIDIIRCKECRYYLQGECIALHTMTRADDFCSYGEKNNE